MTMNMLSAYVAAFAGAAVVCLAPASGQNSLLRNGACELGVGNNGFSANFIPEWTPTTANSPATVLYTPIAGSFPMLTSPGVVRPGRQFFSGGPSTAMSRMGQWIDVSTGAMMIDAGSVSMTLEADLGGFASDGDHAIVKARFFDGQPGPGVGVIGAAPDLGPVTPAMRGHQTGFVFQTLTTPVPSGTRSILVEVEFIRTNGSYCDGYVDNMALFLTPDPLVYPHPAGTDCGKGTVGALAGKNPIEVLQITSQSGDAHRTVAASTGQNIGVSISHPFPNQPALPFVVFAQLDLGTYTFADVTPLGPFGTLCLRPALLFPDPRSLVLADSLGLGGILNGGFGGPNGTPWGTTIQGGFPFPLSVVIQGVILTGGGGVFVTNSVRLVVQ